MTPLAQVRRLHVQAEFVDDDIVEPFLMQQHRNLVDVVGIDTGNHRTLFDIREQCDLAPLIVGNAMLCATQQNVGLNTDGAQFLDGVLCRLGLDLAGARDVGHQRQVHVDHVVAPKFDTHLPNGFQERQRFDVADRTADLHQANIRVARHRGECNA